MDSGLQLKSELKILEEYRSTTKKVDDTAQTTRTPLHSALSTRVGHLTLGITPPLLAFFILPSVPVLDTWTQVRTLEHVFIHFLNRVPPYHSMTSFNNLF